MQTHFIKHRLFISFGVLTSLLCILFGAITWLFAVVTEDDVVKQVMHAEARYIKNVYAKKGELVAPRVDYVTLYIDEDSLPEDIAKGVARFDHEKEFTVAEFNYHFDRYITHDGRYFLLLIEDSKLAVISSLSALLNGFLSVVTLIVMTIALTIAWLISNRIAKPIEKLTSDVLSHKAGTVFPFESAKYKDETSLLREAFATALNENFALLQRERNFTRDVSHELRTPIALLQNTLLLSGEEPIGNEDKALLSQVSESLKNTIEVLLALARSENFHMQYIEAKPLLEKHIVMLHHNMPDTCIEATLALDEKCTVYGNQVLVGLLFQNLISNGIYHSGTQSVTVRSAPNKLIFENSIVAKANNLYQGLGHGNYLVQRIADALNWHVHIDKSESSYRVTVMTRCD